MSVVAGNVLVRVGADISGLTKGLNLAGKSVSKAGAEVSGAMKKISAQTDLAMAKLKYTGDASDNLRGHIETLSAKLNVQSQYVKKLGDEYEKLKAEKGADAEATQKLEAKLIRAQIAEQKLINGIAESTRQLKGNTVAIAQNDSVLGKFQKNLTNISAKMKESGAAIMATGKSLTLALTVPLVAAAGASIKLASDMEESINKVNVAFKKNAKQVQNWSKNTLKNFGILLC